MNYNDFDAPKFVDFGSNFDENGEGDSWFSNDSIVVDPDHDFSIDDSIQASGLAASSANIASDTPAVSTSTRAPLVAPPTSAFVPATAGASTSTVSLPARSSSSAENAGPSSASAPSSTVTTPAGGSVSKLVSRSEFEKNHKKVTQFATTPPQHKRTNSSGLERKNSRRRSLRKAGASLVRSARKAAIRARDKMTPKKKPAPTKLATQPVGITNVEPFQLSTESRAKRVRQEPTTSDVNTPPPKKPAGRLRARNVEPFSVSSKPTAASQAQRAVFQSSAEIQLKFSTKTPERFRTKRVNAGADKQKDNRDEKIGRTILDPKILQNKGKLPTKNRQASTLPKSPAFALKNRKRRRPDEEKTEAKGPTENAKGKGPAKTAAASGLKSSLKTEGKSSEVPKKNVTIPQPFECHTRSKEMMEHKEKVIEKVLDEEKAKREFHAQPLPDLSTAHVPPKKAIPATNPKPFHLMTDERGASKEQDFENRLKEEEEQKKKLVEFKANPPKVLDQAPFVPKAPRKPLTEFKEFQLATNERAEAWEENEARKAEQEAENRAMDEERERMTKLAEEREIKKMREEMVHKAQPVPTYKPMEVQSSVKLVTIPESPNWSKKNSRNTSKL